MKDRSVEYPNRYRMTLVPGTTDIYEMTPVPGEVYEEGTLMSKANILDDNSEMDIWGTIGDRTPNDAFSFIGKLINEHDEDIANIAATLEGKIVTGTYTGNGEASRTISLGFTPKAVLVMNQAGYMTTFSSGYYMVNGGLALQNYPVTANAVVIVTNGFKVAYSSINGQNNPRTNGTQLHHYIAIA